MKPDEYLAKLRQCLFESADDMKPFYEAKLEGAEEMQEIYRSVARRAVAKYTKDHPEYPKKWRESNREAYNAYHREYRRKRKEKEGGNLTNNQK